MIPTILTLSKNAREMLIASFLALEGERFRWNVRYHAFSTPPALLPAKEGARV